MAPPKDIPQRYSASMRHYRHGLAFYDPASSLMVQPGTCGYINENGDWSRIVDITDDVAIQNGGYKGIDMTHVIKPLPSRRYWGPKCTASVRHDNVMAKAGGSGLPVGVPVGASFALEFTLQSDFGAVLVCEGEVKKQGYEHADPFRAWARENATKIVKAFPCVRTLGFYIAITTYSAKDVFINTMMSQGQKVALGLTAKVDPGAKVTTAVGFYGLEATNGWLKPVCEGMHAPSFTHDEFIVTEVPPDDEEKVVFLAGLKFEFHKLSGYMRGVSFVLGKPPFSDLQLTNAPPQSLMGKFTKCHRISGQEIISSSRIPKMKQMRSKSPKTTLRKRRKVKRTKMAPKMTMMTMTMTE